MSSDLSAGAYVRSAILRISLILLWLGELISSSAMCVKLIITNNNNK